MKIETWKDIKDYLNKCSDEQLQGTPTALQTDGWNEIITNIWGLDEDYYVSEVCLEPVSVFEGDPNDPDDTIDQFEIIPKGTFYLMCDEGLYQSTPSLSNS